VPEIDDEDDPVLARVVPGLVLIRIVKHQAPSLLPALGAVSDADGAVAGGHGDPQMAAQPHVGRTPMCGDVGSTTHARDVDEPGGGADRGVGLDAPRGHRAGGADLVAAQASLIQEDHVPIPRAPDPLALRRKSLRAQGEEL
jgi:hypothetical protein